jgi:histone acetyltransferase 1
MYVHIQLDSSFPDNILAAELYKAIYQYIVKHESIAELTVEDPAEAFEDLRDKNDLKMLLSNQQFMTEGFGEQESHGGGRVGGIGRGGKSGRGGAKKASKGKLVPPVDKVWTEKWRKGLKIAGVSMSVAVSSPEY